MEKGLSGNIAKAFITSKLSLLLMVAFLLLGAFSIFSIPREEEPQIEVPMVDILVGYPGATPSEVEADLVRPLEKMASNIKGVEDIYATAMNGMGMLTVQFYVGEDVERSMVKLYSELMKNMDRMPQGATMPLVKLRAIDDVPVLAFTFWSDTTAAYGLRQMAEVVGNEVKKIPNVSDVNVIGGEQRQVRIVLDKEKMAQTGLDFQQVAQALQANNTQLQSGHLLANDEVFTVQTGKFFTEVHEIGQTIVGIHQNNVVYLHQIAQIEDGPEETNNYVSFAYGSASATQQNSHPDGYAAVTLSVSKKKGSDAMGLADKVIEKVEHLKQNVLTEDVHVEVTRNYGLSASHKVSELLVHLAVAILIVTLFVMAAMGWRGGLVVFISVPITFALTLFAYYFLGYTLNRITLFALVFVTGIVTDDSIIIAENMYRHFKMKKLPPMQAAIYAINEVGNPTILATLTVIASVLPMAFVSGMMGPYMSPMPIGSSIAMIFSLLLALTLTPYFGYLFLRHKAKNGQDPLEESETAHLEQSKIYKIYSAITLPFLESRRKRWVFMLTLTAILIGSLSLFYTKSVPVKMLPFDNKNEFQVVIDLPEGTSLERTYAIAQELGLYVAQNEYVTHYQVYAGTSAPISFNGLVRHYDFRRGSHVADIQVNLVDKTERGPQSHDIAKAMRPGLQEIAQRHGANIKVVEVPPGPPVMSTLVAEIYGPDYEQQIAVAEQVKNQLSETDNVVDVDWSVEAYQTQFHVEVDREKAMKSGIPQAQIVQTAHAALSGMPVGRLHQISALAPTQIVLQLPQEERSRVDQLENIQLFNAHGSAYALGDLVKVSEATQPVSIQRKNQKRVVYVLAEVAGDLESPVYAMTAMSEQLNNVQLPEGYTLEENFTAQPESEDDFTVKWDGEWKITYEVFRDLGFAFLLVLIIIYVLIVGWFQHFVTPFVQLAAIPLSLIGIVLGHWMMGAYFSAPSMIGFIALAGIMVRNSVLLIDFIDIRLKEGIPLKQAVIEAGSVRTTPIILTAGGVVLGGIVMLFDPIFQGLAISLIGGTLTSTLLTLVVVPLLYFKMLKNKVK